MRLLKQGIHTRNMRTGHGSSSNRLEQFTRVNARVRERGISGQNLKAEFSNYKHVRGTTSMARAQDPNSADSQFYIMFAPAPHLDRQYTVWGQVVEGMEFVDMIKKGSPSRNGSVTEPDRIIKMQVAADAK